MDCPADSRVNASDSIIVRICRRIVSIPRRRQQGSVINGRYTDGPASIVIAVGHLRDRRVAPQNTAVLSDDRPFTFISASMEPSAFDHPTEWIVLKLPTDHPVRWFESDNSMIIATFC